MYAIATRPYVGVVPSSSGKINKKARIQCAKIKRHSHPTDYSNLKLTNASKRSKDRDEHSRSEIIEGDTLLKIRSSLRSEMVRSDYASNRVNQGTSQPY